MGASTQWLRDLATTLLARPDEIMLELGAGGELLVARIRALLSALVLLLPLLNAAAGGNSSEVLIGLGAAIFINIMAQVWLALARARRRHSWLPFATSTYDITTTTGVLALLSLGDRVSGINSMVVWSFYLIAIAMTALRNDGRLTLYAGGLAIVQYGLLAWAVFASAASPEQLVSADYGTASVATQGERLILLLLMTLLTATIVYRMQRLVEMSGSDGLTGLPNRTWLLQRMPRMFDGVRADGGSLTLALLDLDNFKRINDEAGHLGRRSRHAPYRLGDERSAAAEGTPGAAWAARNSCCCCTARSAAPGNGSTGCAARSPKDPFQPERGAEPQRITFSGGLAAYPQDGADVSAMLRSADRRLQQAKREGRNRVVARDV